MASPDSVEIQTARALVPHRYPAWIWLMAVVVVATLAVALNQLPPYYQAAKLLQRAEALATQGKDQDAAELYRDALKITPSSQRIRIDLAISYFKGPREEDHKKALDVLQGLTIEDDDWKKLMAVMPVSYHHFFNDVKK